MYDLHQCHQQGRKAFQSHGVGGIFRHDHPQHSAQRQAFVVGHDEARQEAAEMAQKQAAAYQALSVRDNVKDRAWAEKLGSLPT